MGILILTLIVIVLIVLYIKRRKEVKEFKEEQQLFIKKREEKERKSRKLKDEEDLELNVEESVLCDDGVERKYSKSMYGIIKERISSSSEKFRRSSYDLGKSKTPTVYANMGGERWDEYEDRVLLFISTEKWFSEKGHFLNSAEILNLYYLAKKKQNEYRKRYSDILPRRTSTPNDRTAAIFIINDIYFIETLFLGFKLFDGKLNDIQYKQGMSTH